MLALPRVTRKRGNSHGSIGWDRRRYLSVSIITALGGCLDRNAAGPESEPDDDSSSGSTDRRDREVLQPPLPGLIGATDREEYAADHGLEYENGTVRVQIRLESDDVQSPEAVESVDSRSGSLVFATVTVDKIRSLAEGDGVQSVRPPAEPVGDGR